VFLAGHSMGGGEVLGFATQPKESPHHAKVSSLTGIIAMSPLIHLTKPTAKPLRAVGGFLSKIMPYAPFPADAGSDGLSRDPKVAEEYLKDPLIKLQGTLRGLNDMFTQGEQLLEVLYANWPEDLPVLLCHGTDDKVTSFPATQGFCDKLSAKKKFVPFQDAYHELYNEIGDIPDRLVNEIVTFIAEHCPPPKAKI